MSDPRPRNNQGQFAPESGGGLDPNTTSTAYNPQIIEQRRASLLEKIRRMRGVRNGVEESVPPNQQLSANLRLRELARQAYDPYAPAEPGQGARDFRNAALGLGALAAGGGVAYAGWRGAQAAKSAQVLTDDALKTSAEARKAARSARVAAARVGRAGKWAKTQMTTFPTFKKAGQAVARVLKLDARLELKELAARSVEFAKEIGVEDIQGNYIEHPGRKRHIVGGALGTIAGGVAGLAAARKLRMGSGVATPAALAGAIGGAFIADPKGDRERRRQMREARHTMREAWQTDAVPVETIQSNIPIASSYFGVAGELKKQKVGFFKRHGAALATGGIRSGENAAFLPYGDKGVIVSPKRVPKVVIRHEQGHAKDYKIHGDFEKVYPRYGENTWDAREYLQNTLLPEERAWRHARPRGAREVKLKNATLGSYAAGGGFTRKPTEFDARLELKELAARSVELNSITYHETNADILRRKARVHRERRDEASGMWPYAVAAPGILAASPALRAESAGRVASLGNKLWKGEHADNTAHLGNKIAKVLKSHPGKVVSALALAPAAVLGGKLAYHTVAARSKDSGVNKELKLANKMRRQRNAEALKK